MSIKLTDQQADGWLARLEDPATRRATGRLRSLANPEVMCCLGHLADIIDPEAWKMVGVRWSWDGGTTDLPEVTYRGLPLDQLPMTKINDGKGRFPIPEIRQWIEEARTQ